MRSSYQGLGYISGKSDATVGNDRNIGIVQRFSHIADRRDLRDTDTSDNARSTDRSRTNSDLDRIDSGRYQIFCRSGGGDVTADNLHLGIVFLDPGYAIEYAQ